MGDAANFFAGCRQRSGNLSSLCARERAFTAADDRWITKPDELLLPRPASAGASASRSSILHCAAQQQYRAGHVCNVTACKQRLPGSIGQQFYWKQAEEPIRDDQHMRVAVLRERRNVFGQHAADFLKIFLP